MDVWALRQQLIRAMRSIDGNYHSWPSMSADEDARVENGDESQAPCIGRVADAVLSVLLGSVKLPLAPSVRMGQGTSST